VIWHQVSNSDRLFDFREKMPDRGRIELYIFFEVELPIVGISAELVIDVPRPAGRVFGKQRCRRAANKLRGFAKDVAPLRGINRSIIDFADEPRELFCLICHSAWENR
jgi:hypothetical protein